MAQLMTIYNLVLCGLSAVLGTGTKGCKQFFKKATSLWLVPDGFEFDGSETLNDTYVQTLQAQGNLIVLKGAKTFVDNSTDDTFETLDDGTEQLATLGLYKFALTFINGLAFHAALTSLNSFGSYNVLLVDREGNILGTKSDSGNLKGFSLNYLQAMKLSFATDAVGQKEGIGFQLSSRQELDKDYVYIAQSNLGTFKPQNVDGIHEVVLSMNTVPSDTDTSIIVDAKLKQNGKPFTGADDLANFVVTINGSEVTPSAISEATDGTYTFTVTALATNDVVTVALYDSSNNRSVIILDSDLYKSNTISTTVVA